MAWNGLRALVICAALRLLRCMEKGMENYYTTLPQAKAQVLNGPTNMLPQLLSPSLPIPLRYDSLARKVYLSGELRSGISSNSRISISSTQWYPRANLSQAGIMDTSEQLLAARIQSEELLRRIEQRSKE